jgi:predicted AAA+ superfamily ATPase
MIITKNDPHLLGVVKERFAVGQVREALKDRSVVILYGPRKVGKTTALKQIGLDNPKMHYIDCGTKRCCRFKKHL